MFCIDAEFNAVEQKYRYPYRETNRHTYLVVETSDGWRVDENIRPAPRSSTPHRQRKKGGAHSLREASSGCTGVALLERARQAYAVTITIYANGASRPQPSLLRSDAGG